VARYGPGLDQAPGIDELVDLDREIRRAFAGPPPGYGTGTSPAA